MEKEKSASEEIKQEGDELPGGGCLDQSMLLSEAMVETDCEQKSRALQIPPDFRCPLSLELMSDPVIVASGQTYERSYIQQWLDQGDTTCPKTRQTLTHTNLIPNYTVKALIANWCEAHSVPFPEPGKIDMLNPILRRLTTVMKANAESEERRVAPPSIPVPESSAVIRRRPHEGSSSGIGSRPSPKSKRTVQPKLFHDREFQRKGFQVTGEDRVETSQLVSRNPRSHNVDGGINLGRTSLLEDKYDASPRNDSPSCNFHQLVGSGSSVASIVEDVQGSSTSEDGTATLTPASLSSSDYPSDASGEMEKLSIASAVTSSEEVGSLSRLPDRMAATRRRRHGEERDMSLPRIVPSPVHDNLGGYGNAELVVDGLVLDLVANDINVQRQAAAQLRLLAKYNMENRIMIANSGAIRPLVVLLKSMDPETQENAVTALLNLSINDNNKSEIAAAGAIYPLVNVLKTGTAQAMENAAATLFSLSVMDDNKVAIGASGAIPPLVHLLINGTPRGKKDAATALFNLSIFHENKARIVRAGAIKPLIELMADPAAGMVDKAVAVLANLATIPEGRVAIGEEGGIPALVEVVEAGSQRGKEYAAAALLQLCMNSHKHRALVLQEGAIPPLVALSQSGTARAKEKASALLRHFREQRHQVLGPRPAPDKHMSGQYYF